MKEQARKNVEEINNLSKLIFLIFLMSGNRHEGEGVPKSEA